VARCHEREHLEQVRNDHVSVRAGGVIEVGPVLESECLWDVDLDMVDEVAVPDRLEQAVREAKRQDVLRRLLTEEVIDAEDLPLSKGLMQAGVQGDRALQIAAERLLQDHA
jgi:hypothetical protein